MSQSMQGITPVPNAVISPPENTGINGSAQNGVVVVAGNVGNVFQGYAYGGVNTSGVQMGSGSSTNLGPVYQGGHNQYGQVSGSGMDCGSDQGYSIGGGALRSSDTRVRSIDGNGVNTADTNTIGIGGAEASTAETCHCSTDGCRYTYRCCDTDVCCLACDSQCIGDIFKMAAEGCKLLGSCLNGTGECLCGILSSCDECDGDC